MVDKDRDTGRTGRVVYALNKVTGWSQEDIAKDIGVSFTSVNAWVASKRLPRANLAEKLDILFRRVTSSPRTLEERVRAIVGILHIEYGSPRLGNKKDPLDELFFILLSLKTSHRTYEDTFERFRARYHPWSKLLHSTSEDVEAHIRRGGLGSIKARAFIDIAKCLESNFGKVSLAHIKKLSAEEAEKYLCSLPGVGIKTARCVLMYSLGRDVIPVDAHTYRVGVRLGLIPTSSSPSASHANFDHVAPKGLAYSLHTNFVALGRDICLDPTPKCHLCPIRSLCDYAKSRESETQEVGASNVSVCGARNIVRSPASRKEFPCAVDIYAGCGGLSNGLEDAGYRVAYALDWDGHACETHKANLPAAVVECRDVREVTGNHIKSLVGGQVDLVAGGPNCQGVSERGLRSPDDPRNFMFPEFVRLVEELRPTAFLMENVPGLAHRHNYELLRSIFSSFEELGYMCAADVLLAANYGVPQLRYRFFLVGTLVDVPLSFPAPTHFENGHNTLFGRPFVSTWDGIGDLPEIDATCQEDGPLPYRTSDPANEFQRYVREGSGVVMNHVCSATDMINLLRASHVPEGGNWKDIPRDILPKRFFCCRMTDHSTTYARLRRDMPAFTITALFGNITSGAFTHPLANRALSVREGARLQSFRDRFIVCGPRNSQYRQIGNAVPPLLARAVAAHLRKLVSGQRAPGVQARITGATLKDKREWDALPVLTPRFKETFGEGTRWPKGWGPEPQDYSALLDNNYTLRPEFWPDHIAK